MVGRALATCFLLFTVYGAIIPDQGQSIKRTPRCDVCDEGQRRLPHFPPPPYFHTHQWSGVARNSDGSQQGVFSGAAAAAAANSGTQANEEAFSLASSSINGGGGSYRESNNDLKKDHQDSSYHKSNGDQNFAQGGNAEGFGHGANLHQTQSNGFDQGQQVQSKNFGSAASSQSQSEIGKSWDEAKYGSNHVGGDINSVGAHERGDLIGARNDGSRAHVQNSHDDGSFDARQQQNYHSSLGVNTGQQQEYHSGSYKGGRSNSIQSTQQHADSGFGGNTQEVQKANYDTGRWNSNKDSANDNNGHIAGSQSSSGVGTGGVRDEGQATLQGALDLTSQGLQSAQQIQQAQPGCSTCGKSNYALSNAKSKSGNAVAVSIGG